VTTPNSFTVDLEDWYQGLEIDIDEWDRFAPRVERGLAVLLDLLAEAGVRATFFVLGYQAERTPTLIREIAARGHEIASHGWTHRFVYRIGRDAFRDELRRSKAVLEDIVGAPVEGSRAPFFSITSQSLWALDVLVEEGFRYDSSVFPVLSYRYGIPGARRSAGPLTTPSGANLFEIPLSTCRLPGVNVPISGGGYFRLYPYALTRALARRLHREGLPLVFYVHPWEYDVDHPRVAVPRAVPGFTHYHNLRSMAPKTRQLLREHRFMTLRDAYGDAIRAAS
jgi:polysaccharide deacetylase family protein (PEP-CTERM system associated)